MHFAYSSYLSASDDFTIACNQAIQFIILPRTDSLRLQAYVRRLYMPIFELPNLRKPFSASEIL